MKKNLFTLSAMVVMLAFLFSCSTQKIGSNDGYTFKYHKAVKHTPAQVVKAEADEDVLVVNNDVPEVIAATENQTEAIIPTVEAVQPRAVDSEEVVKVLEKVVQNAQAAPAAKKESITETIVKKAAAKKIAKAVKKNKPNRSDVPVAVLYILALFIPVLAVGFATNWDVMPMVYNLLWTLLCGIPGIIHAFIVIAREA